MTKNRPRPAPASGAACISCLLLDIDFQILAQGELQGQSNGWNIPLTVLDGRVVAVVQAELIHVFPDADNTPAWTGRVLQRRGNCVMLEPLKRLGPEAWRNLCVDVDFDSFAYLPAGGRVPIRAVDLSCDGLSFSADWDFAPCDRFETVIPITREGPLLLQGDILGREERGGTQVYTSQFVDLCSGEEAKIREAVFRVQIESSKSSGKNKSRKK